MIAITVSAIAALKAIQVEHPEDAVVRITVRDVDESRLSFSITLEEASQPHDDVQQIDGLTIAMDRQSAPRMDGVTVDYTTAAGFSFLHADEGWSHRPLTIPTLN